MPETVLVPTRIVCDWDSLCANVEFDDGHVLRMAADLHKGIRNVQLLVFQQQMAIYHVGVSWRDRNTEDRGYKKQPLEVSDRRYTGEVVARYWRQACRYIMQVSEDPGAAGILDSSDTNYAFAYSVARASLYALGRLEES